MTFEEFKNTFPWVFAPGNIEYHVSTTEEVLVNNAGEEKVEHRVEISISSTTSNGELSAAVSLEPENANTFITQMQKYLSAHHYKGLAA